MIHHFVEVVDMFQTRVAISFMLKVR